MPTVQEIHTIWPTARVLASNYISNGALFGAPTNANLAIQIELIGYAVDYQYEVIEQIDVDSVPSASLTATSNYLFQWCGQFGVAAFALYQAGGIIPTPSGNIVYGPPVTAVYTATSDGETSLTINLPTGAIVVFASIAARILTSNQYQYVSPDLNLLGGLELSIDTELFYQYSVPIT